MARRSRTRTIALAIIALVVAGAFLLRRTGLSPGGPPPFDPADYTDVPVVEAQDAASVVGEKAVVCGTVVNAVFTADTRGQPTFLNLSRPYPDQPFDAVIWGRDRERFHPPPEMAWREERICVAGPVTTHQGVPRIQVSTPAQIQLESWRGGSGS